MAERKIYCILYQVVDLMQYEYGLDNALVCNPSAELGRELVMVVCNA